MGSCFSKNNTTPTPNPTLPTTSQQSDLKSDPPKPQNPKNEPIVIKKEIFVIKHRISQEIDRFPNEDDPNLLLNPSSGSGNKVDEILIQCGRLSRSNSAGDGNPSRRRRRRSGSKRSFDFDLNLGLKNNDDEDGGGGGGVEGLDHRRRRRERWQEGSRVSSPGSRRSSRERDFRQVRCGSSGGRRISISPSRRSESPVCRNSNGGVGAAGAGANGGAGAVGANDGGSIRPMKMVPVPATDKSNNAGGEQAANGGSGAGAAANGGSWAGAVANGGLRVGAAANGCSGAGAVANGGSRVGAAANGGSGAVAVAVANGGLRAGVAANGGSGVGAAANGGGSVRPMKMVPIPATDKSNISGGNTSGEQVGGSGGGGGVKRIHVKRNVSRSRSPARKNLRIFSDDNSEEQWRQEIDDRVVADHSSYKRKSLAEIDNNAARSVQPKMAVDDAKMAAMVENLKLYQNVKTTRIFRRSEDLDMDPSPPSYASLLLEDIHNFHQKNTNSAAAATAIQPPFSLPECVSKACSIMEAVADLNSSTTTTTAASSSLFSDDRWRKTVANGGLMEPSLQNYVTMRRGGFGSGSVTTDEQESSDSNSLTSSQRLNRKSPSVEPNSATPTTRKCEMNRLEDFQSKLHDRPRKGIGRGRKSAYPTPEITTVD